MKILLVCKGDATLRKTWSGVPRIVYDRLKAEGHEVKLLNVFGDFWFHAIGAVWNVTRDYRKKEFETTRIGGWLLSRAVRRAAKGCDQVVALTFALDANGIGVPVELIHDWTRGYFWNIHDKTEDRQLERIRHASKVSCIYPAAAEYLKAHGINAEYVGLPICVPGWVAQRARDKGIKAESRRYVVLASPWHKDNFDAAIEYLKNKEATLDVIGMNGRNTDRIFFHGYLDKDVPSEEEEYWEILLNADCLLALGKTWPGGSSIAECRACGCQIITQHWPDLRDVLRDER